MSAICTFVDTGTRFWTNRYWMTDIPVPLADDAPPHITASRLVDPWTNAVPARPSAVAVSTTKDLVVQLNGDRWFDGEYMAFMVERHGLPRWVASDPAFPCAFWSRDDHHIAGALMGLAGVELDEPTTALLSRWKS